MRDSESAVADLWNRKDRRADETVEYIKKILDDCEIQTEVVFQTNYSELWYSNRVEIESFPSLGTNGKGVTEDYALASGYGEFMERLQSGFLLTTLYPNKQVNDVDSILDRAKYLEENNILEKYFKIVLNDSNDKESLYAGIAKLSEIDTYFDVWKHREVKLPAQLIDFLSGSSGLCAGNTYEEAFVQGMSEVFERYVIKYIYQGNYDDDMFASVDESVYRDLNSYKMIQAIEAKQYKVYIIDCTLHGKMPVLGVLITDKSKTKYAYRMGADIDLDICIQRCITEIFQGLNFDIYFSYQMRDMFREESSGDFWNQGDDCLNYIKSIVDGNGYLPRKFLKAMNRTVKKLTIYEKSEKKNNLDAIRCVIDIAKNTFETLVIKDEGILGFPTMRIFVPGFSEAFYYRQEDVVDVWKKIDTVREYVRKGNINHKIVLDCILDIMKYQSYCYDYSLRKLFGIVLKDNTKLEHYNNPYLLITLLAMHLGYKEIAYENIRKSGAYLGKSKVAKEMDNLLVEAILKGVAKEEFLAYMEPFNLSEEYRRNVEYFYEIVKNGVQIYCEDCSKCDIRENCNYDEYAKIKHIIKSSRSKQSAIHDEYLKLLEHIKD